MSAGRAFLSIFFALLALTAGVAAAQAPAPPTPAPPGPAPVIKDVVVQGNRRVQEAVILGRVERQGRRAVSTLPPRRGRSRHLRARLLRRRAAQGRGLRGRREGHLRRRRAAVRARHRLQRQQEARHRHTDREDRPEAGQCLQSRRGQPRRREAQGGVRAGGLLRGRGDARDREAARWRRDGGLQDRGGAQDHDRPGRDRGRPRGAGERDQGGHGHAGARLLRPARDRAAPKAGRRRRAHRRPVQRLRLYPGARGVLRRPDRSGEREGGHPRRRRGGAAVQGRRGRRDRDGRAARRGDQAAHQARSRRCVLPEQAARQHQGHHGPVQRHRAGIGRRHPRDRAGQSEPQGQYHVRHQRGPGGLRRPNQYHRQ